MRDHAAATATRHWFAASARKIRSVERDTRWPVRIRQAQPAACLEGEMIEACRYAEPAIDAHIIFCRARPEPLAVPERR